MFAICLENTEDKYIQTLHVSKVVATGVFKNAKQEKYKYITGEKRAPQTLPFWTFRLGTVTIQVKQEKYSPISVR